MNVAFFSAKKFERAVFKSDGSQAHPIKFFDTHLNAHTAPLAAGSAAVCAFVSDCLDAETIGVLARGGCRVIALRSAGYNHVDLAAAEAHGIPVLRVPAYSPNAVAEHAVGLMLSLNRRLHKAYNRVREGNFSLEGLTGFDMSSRCLAVVGTGLIGATVARILLGFGSRVLAYDPAPNEELRQRGVEYVSLEQLFREADVISLHCPLNAENRHLIDAKRLATMRHGVMIINTGRGGLIDTKAVIAGLKSGRVGHLGLDVYEEEEGLFFEDFSDRVLEDDVFARLLTFPNVLITGHQAFLTHEALAGIAQTTLDNLTAFETGQPLRNRVKASAR